MEEIILEAHKRTAIGSDKVRKLRKAANIPAVVYGQGKKSLSIQLRHKDFAGLLSSHRGESFVLKLKIKDGDKVLDKAVLIKEIQYHPVKDSIAHVDFNEISLSKMIKVKIPVAVAGESIGVKQDGGMLEHILWELEIECLPTQIPKHIDVDVSALKIGDSVHVKDLIIPAGVKALNDPQALVLAVVMPMKEEPVAPVEGAEGEIKAEPEVIKEKKEKPEEAKAEAKK